VLREGGIVVAEHEKRFDPGDGDGNLKRFRLLKQGESALSFYRRSAQGEPEGD
jgi:16S rRNA G966 N2-methylase RsmD